MTRSMKRLSIVAVVLALLLGAAAYAGTRLLRDQVDRGIPQADLFGPTESASPSPASPSPSASPSPPPGADIKGPLNFLIVGIDTRENIPTWRPLGDAVMILHVTRDLSRAYLVSLPRDLLVSVPAFPPARFGGDRSTKLTHAMGFGSRVPGSDIANPAQGFALMARTVSGYTGITRFDAGAVLTFNGLSKLVDALGGIDMYIDQTVVSIHRRPDGRHREPCSSCEHNYSGPRATYRQGQAHLVGWQAIDYARQRYTAGSDYARQRHQRQLIEAILTKARSTDVLTNPASFQRVLDALGQTLTFDGRGRKPTEFLYALRAITPATLHLVGLPGGGVFADGRYLGERLDGTQVGFFAALRADKLDDWAKAHPSLVNRRGN